MGLEIERKFLVVGDAWRDLDAGVLYRQGYLNRDRERVVRVRTMGPQAVLTVKSAPTGLTRQEFEYPIPLADAEELLALCLQPIIEKTRRMIPLGELLWEVDEFHGVNEGLVLAECELRSENQAVARPAWVGREVTGDPRYFNSNLIARPFGTW